MLALSFSHAALRRGSAFVTVSVVALVILADLFFYGHALGWTAGAFTAMLLFALTFRPAIRRSRMIARLLGVAIAALAIALVEEPTPLALYVTSVAIVLLAITSRQGWTSSILLWLERLAKFLVLGWTKILRDSFIGARRIKRHPLGVPAGPVAALWVASKWIVPLLLGGVFLWLFSLANPIVERWVTHVINSLTSRAEAIPDVLEIERISFWIAALVILWGLLRVRTRRARRRRAPLPVSASTGPAPDFVALGEATEIPTMTETPAPQPDPGIFSENPVRRTIMPVSRHALVERCLIVFNLVFAMETVLDVLYLTGGRRLPHGITYKEYAHRGSYPLIATALLAALFVLIAFGRQCRGVSWRRARALVYLWIMQNVLLTISAGWRLLLLVNASNLTRWRLATTIWLGLVAAGLITIIWRIVSGRDNAWLLRINLAMTALVFYVCCFINLDGFVANYNADHCLEVARNGDVLGLTYLRDIGPESIPALDRLSHTLDTAERRAMAHRFAEQLRGDVTEQLKDWRGWTWRRSRLHDTGRGVKRPPESSSAWRRGRGVRYASFG